VKKKILKLNVDEWLTDRRIRLCTPAARAFLIDLRALCVPSGRLVMDDLPLSDEQIALLCGYSVAKVKELFKELGAAKAFQVDDNGLYFAAMVKDSAFKAQAKVSGAKAKKPAKTYPQIPPPTPPIVAVEPAKQPAPAATQVAAPAKPAKKPAPWYKTPAGWVRKGQEQGLSMAADEAYETFQLRVAKRLPDGLHLDYVPASVAKAVRAEIEQGKEAIKAAIPEQFRVG
jgi:hypothetical protein